MRSICRCSALTCSRSLWRKQEIYLQVFDFDMLKKFVARSDFKLTYDSMYAITAAYAKPLFVDLLGCDASVLRNAEAKDDFNGGHPDPNLTYAKVRCGVLG